MYCKISGFKSREDELVKIKENLVLPCHGYQYLRSIINQNGRFSLDIANGITIG